MFLLLHFHHSNVPDKKCHKQVAHAIFYTHQTSGACAGVCMCDRMHQMEQSANVIHSLIKNGFVRFSKSWGGLLLKSVENLWFR